MLGDHVGKPVNLLGCRVSKALIIRVIEGWLQSPLGFDKVRTAKAPAAEREVEALSGWIAQ
jgi:hypothetical protein